MDSLMQVMEFASYAVTVIGLPLAIAVFILEQRKERESDEEEIYQKLSDEYAGFLRLVLQNSDLQLRSPDPRELSSEQQERRTIIFDLLVSLFERAYILAYEEKMDRNQRRRWKSWEDYMVEWCRREDFRKLLPKLLIGEDQEFAEYIAGLARGVDPSFSLGSAARPPVANVDRSR